MYKYAMLVFLNPCKKIDTWVSFQSWTSVQLDGDEEGALI